MTLAAAVVYLLLYFYLPGGPGERLRNARGPLAIAPRTAGAVAIPGIPDVPAFATHETVAETAPVSSTVFDESPAVAANALLEKFLHAKDAASRVGMVEPATSEEELAATMLKGPLAEVAQVFSDLPHHNPVEQVTDFPYRVSFFVPGKPNVDYAMLVRQRGNQPPKVFLPAFLDLVGGELAAFTKEPNDQDPAKFHVILDAVTGCHDESVPNSERKFTFKLLPSPFGRETARAYVSVNSRFKKMVDDPASSLRWGVRVRATVTLQWNRTENPAMPYLELIEINSLNWNP